MCDCVNVEMGSHANECTRLTPWGKRVSIDRCIVEEIEHLWSLGVRTLGSCCGHNKQPGSIVVDGASAGRMLAWGYVVKQNPFLDGCDSLDFFAKGGA